MPGGERKDPSRAREALSREQDNGRTGSYRRHTSIRIITGMTKQEVRG